MEIDWNIPPEVLSPPDDATIAAAKLAADINRFVTPEEVPPPDAEAEPTPESQQTPPAQTDPALVDRVYHAQALHSDAIDTLAGRVIALFSKVADEDVRACAIGRAMIILGDPYLVTAAYEIESAALPQKGDRVKEENGAIGTVISLLSLTEAVVKWDGEARAMRSLLKYLERADP